MSVERHHRSSRMSQICVHGDTVYLAGQVADEATGRDCAAQAKQILDKIDRYLAQVGSDKSKLIQVTIWLRDMGDYTSFNGVWDAWIAREHPPARACIQAELAHPDWRVELMLTAAMR